MPQRKDWLSESINLLDEKALKALRKKKSLLAFSGGVDSTALFFLLMGANVEFDIAIVNYQTRATSKDEEEYAKELAGRYGKRCFALCVSPPSKNFEAEARRIRYGFFEKIIEESDYKNLITAHQLNDRLEWFFMRLSKGAGVRELIGGEEVQDKDGYTLVKPLFKTSRKSVYGYLADNGIKYFEDESNSDTKYERNFFRSGFADSFMENFEDGVRRSFDILSHESSLFESRFFEKDLLIVFASVTPIVDDSNISKALKKIGYLPSSAQRKEIAQNYDAVVGGSFCVAKNKIGFIFVSPSVKVVMPKEFKEECRVLGMPSKIRGYLFDQKISPILLKKELDYFLGSLGGFR